MYDLEDISENMGDGFIWYSIIINMEAYRAQVMRSSSGVLKVIHMTDNKDNLLDGDEYAEEIAAFLEQELNLPDDFDESDEWKEIEEHDRDFE